ncbi:DUF159 family protein [Tateyamaria omphalii]|nr:DUF159 family protein [Tateyamaria omphalii]
MRQLFDVPVADDHLGNAAPLPSIYPKGAAPVVRLGPDGERELVKMSWGFRTPKVSKKTGKPIKPAAWNNARDDKLHTGLWKSSFQQRRCLVPASSFCESKGRNPATHYWFGMASDDLDERPPFAFAGFWRDEYDDLAVDAQGLSTYTIITTTANELVKPVHPQRMPVILAAEEYEEWLFGSSENVGRLLKPFPSEHMRVVGQGVGMKADDPARTPV